MSDGAVLIIDDEPGITFLLEDRIKEGIDEVLTAETVEDSLIILKNFKFDCIVLDIHIGDKNGAEVVRFLAEHSENQNHKTPIVLHSGFINP